MLFLDGVGVEAFVSKVAAGDRPVLYCPVPTCGSRLHGHGGYERYLGDVLCRVFRVRCRPCGVTHVVLPGNVCAYRDLTLETVEAVVDADSPSEGGRHLDPPPVDGRRVARRIRRAFEAQMVAVVGALPPVSEWGLSGLREVVGSRPGALVRLRQWLISTQDLWFSGLCGLWRHAEMLSDLGALNRVFWAWLEGEYHQTPHRGLEGKTPMDRFLADQDYVRPAPDEVERLLRMKVKRRVGRDRTVRLESRLYEAPDGWAGETVEILYDPYDPLAPVALRTPGGEQEEIRLRRLDLTANAKLPRPARKPSEDAPEAPEAPTTGISYLDLIARRFYGEEE